MKIKELPKEDRPREKAFTYGVESLSDEELLSIIISKGVKNKSALEISRSLLNEYTNIYCLSKAKTIALKNEYGLSKISALKLEAIFELFSRLNAPKYKSREQLKNIDDIYKKYQFLSEQKQELLVILMLDKKYNILKEKIMYKGSENSLPISLREIAVELLQSEANYFYLIHNHPNGDNKPSTNDIESTYVISKRMKQLEIILLDHIIVSSDSYFSFRREKLL